MKSRLTPIKAAKIFREMFANLLPKDCCDHSGLSAYRAAKLVEEQCKCSYRAAAIAVQVVMPELFADHWN